MIFSTTACTPSRDASTCSRLSARALLPLLILGMILPFSSQSQVTDDRTGAPPQVPPARPLDPRPATQELAPSSPTASPQAKKPIVAVLDFMSTTLTPGQEDAFTQVLVSKFNRSRETSVLPLKETRQYLIEKDLYPNLPVGPKVALDLVARAVHADYLVWGHINQIGDAFAVDYSVFSTKRGGPIAINTSFEKGSLDELLAKAPTLAESVINAVALEQHPERAQARHPASDRAPFARDDDSAASPQSGRRSRAAAENVPPPKKRESENKERMSEPLKNQEVAQAKGVLKPADEPAKAPAVKKAAPKPAHAEPAKPPAEPAPKAAEPQPTPPPPSETPKPEEHAAPVESTPEPNPAPTAEANPAHEAPKPAEPAAPTPKPESKTTPAPSPTPKPAPPEPAKAAVKTVQPSPAPPAVVSEADKKAASEAFAASKALAVDSPQRIALLKKAVTLDPSDGSYKRSLGTSYYWAGDYEESILACLEAVKLLPDDSLLFTLLGSAYFESEQYDEARQAQETAIKIDPNNHFARFNLALALQAQGSPRAVDAWEDYLKRSEGVADQESNRTRASANLAKLKSEKKPETKH